MVNIIYCINTLCFIYVITNPKIRGALLTAISSICAFLMKEFDNEFKRHDEFIKYLVEDLQPLICTNEVINDNGVIVEEVTVVTNEVISGNEEVINKVTNDTNEVTNDTNKIEVKFEDKYLQKLKGFPNNYSFTEEELQLEQQKYDELRDAFMLNKTNVIKEFTIKIHKIQRILDCVTDNDVTDEGIQRLIKYYDIECEYNDNPDDYMLSDLFGELSEILKESLLKLKEQEANNITDDELKEQAKQFMLDKKLDGFINNYVSEMTPLGNVYMRYNNSKKSFEYYSNNTIPYRYLDTVGRKFVVTYFCKPLFVDIEEELKKALQKKTDEKDKKALDKKELDKKAINENAINKKDVFAKMKSYNNSSNTNEMSKMDKRNVLPPQFKANLPNVNIVNSDEMLLKEHANRYTWEGRLANMNLLKKIDRKVVDKTYTMSFADFKRLQRNK